MTTREVYVVRCSGDRTCGVQLRDGEESAGLAEQLHMLMCAAGTVGLGSVHALEALIRATFPGRAFWLEVGDDTGWVQLVEYGAFANKPHKAGRR